MATCNASGLYEYDVSIDYNTKFCWTGDLGSSTFSGALVVSNLETGWLAWGLNPQPQMIGTDAVLGIVDQGTVQQYQVQYKGQSGVTARAVQSLTDSAVTSNGTTTMMTFTRPIQATDSYGQSVNETGLWMIWAHGATSTLQYHGSNRRGTLQVAIQLESSESSASGSATPIFNNSTATNYRALYAHGLCMAAAFWIIVPVAIMMSRYVRHSRWGKETSRGRPAGLGSSGTGGGKGGKARWFKLHMGLQLLAFALMMAALGLIVHFMRREWGDARVSDNHNKTGVALLSLVALQILGALLRPHASRQSSLRKSRLEILAGGLHTHAHDQPAETHTHAHAPAHGGSLAAAEAVPRQHGRGIGGALKTEPEFGKSLDRGVWEISHRVLAVCIIGFSIYQVLNGISIAPSIDSRKWSLAFMGVILGIVVIFCSLEFTKKYYYFDLPKRDDEEDSSALGNHRRGLISSSSTAAVGHADAAGVGDLYRTPAAAAAPYHAGGDDDHGRTLRSSAVLESAAKGDDGDEEEEVKLDDRAYPA